uniref:NADH-ubiquinone oxidoreductase chain 1 n=1 Tax=Wiebesia pumilae TaxID=150944 RepID=A0A8A3UWW3_9HYME|nr:NADH dehydrogenase subunit 1 [Wiebesia pumilae]
MSYMMIIFMSLDVVILVLISISFLTLLERKVLGHIHMRKGPNKVMFFGMMQPLSDGFKLMLKEVIFIHNINYYYYMFSPLLSMTLMFMLWLMLPFYENYLHMNMHILLILCIMSLGVYGLMLSGWASNSTYSMLGSLRSIAQTISYEASMMFIIYSILMMMESFSLMVCQEMQYYCWFIMFLYPTGFMLYVSFLAELNRTPFDFSEGESELVSGFNVEYMGGPFALFMVAEYGMILFVMYLFSMLLLGGNINSIMFYLVYLFMVFSVLWVRGTMPRMRYDEMMYLTWKSFLPSIMMILIILFMFKSVMFYI